MSLNSNAHAKCFPCCWSNNTVYGRFCKNLSLVPLYDIVMMHKKMIVINLKHEAPAAILNPVGVQQVNCTRNFAILKNPASLIRDCQVFQSQKKPINDC